LFVGWFVGWFVCLFLYHKHAWLFILGSCNAFQRFNGTPAGDAPLITVYPVKNDDTKIGTLHVNAGYYCETGKTFSYLDCNGTWQQKNTIDRNPPFPILGQDGIFNLYVSITQSIIRRYI